MKKILLIANLFFVFLFSSCDLFKVNLGDYFEEYTNNAAIELHEFDASYPIASGAENLPSTSGDKTIKFTLRNPQQYTLDLSQTGLTGELETDYTLTQSDDKNSILLTLKESYLQTIDADQTAGADKLSVTIEIVDSVSLRAFEPYTVDFIVNTPPPAVTNAALYTSGGKWVIAFEFPTFTEEHKDIKTITINDTSFDIDKFIGSEDLPTGFTKDAPNDLLDATATNATGLSSDNVYYKTDTPINISLSTTIKLVDNYGLSSSVSTNQAGIPIIATDGAWDGVKGEKTINISEILGFNIYYTTNGENPSRESKPYTEPFKIDLKSGDIIVKAIAVKDNYANSPIVTEVFERAEQVTPPTVTVDKDGTLTIRSIPDDATIYYTTDGNDPTTGSQYDSDSKPKLTTNTTIKAIAYKDGMLNSNIGTGYYIVEAYADGTNGNDNATGYDENSPVQTFATAKAKLTTESGTIWVMDKLEVDGTETWFAKDGKTITVKRHESNTGAIVNVAEGNSLALSDITLDGQGGVDGLDGNVTATTRMVTSSGTLELGLGAIIQNGNIGGVSVYGGTFTMNDGSIQYNKGSEHGGGVYVNAGEFKMLGGTISNNTATSYGGGVFVNTGEFKMSGGTISNNTGNYSGGVHVSTTGKFEMSGGTISENTATSKGGGIYLKDEGAKLKLRGNPQITGNTADGNKKNIEFTNNTTSSPIQITGALDGANIGLSPISTDEGDVLAVSGDNYTIQVSDVGAFSLDAAPDGVALSLEGSGASATIKLVGPASNDFTIDAYGGIKYTGTATGVVIPESINGTPVTKIGEKAFYENTTITNVVIPDTVTKIGSTAFRDCENLTNVTFGENVKEIGGQAFLYTKITSVNLPESLEIIGSQAFSNLALASIIIPDSVITIEDEAFYKNKFSTIDIPKNVESIGSQAFCYNNSLATITVVGLPTGSSAYFIVDDNVLYNKAKTELVLYPAKKEGSTFSIPSDVTRINGGAFTDSAYLENVFIPRTVEVIEREAFAFCSKLKSITLPKEVKEVENYTFRHTPVYAEGDCSSTGFDDSWDWDCTYITNCELSTDVYPYVVSVTKSDATYINPDNKTLDAPCREGYTFKGWSSDGSTVLGSGSADYLRNADYGTYYAVWEEN